MKFPMYSIRDVHVGYMAPRLDSSDVTARRQFAYEINNRDGVMNFKPSDFDLYKIGDFDADSGLVTAVPPVFICSGSDVFGGD